MLTTLFQMSLFGICDPTPPGSMCGRRKCAATGWECAKGPGVFPKYSGSSLETAAPGRGGRWVFKATSTATFSRGYLACPMMAWGSASVQEMGRRTGGRGTRGSAPWPAVGGDCPGPTGSASPLPSRLDSEWKHLPEGLTWAMKVPVPGGGAQASGFQGQARFKGGPKGPLRPWTKNRDGFWSPCRQVA